MAIARAQISFPMDSALPRDEIVITPHFNGVTNYQNLADDLLTNLKANAQIGASTPFKVKVYDAQGPKPNLPKGEAHNGTGFSTSPAIRETALCLSFYAGINTPRNRGRLFIPFAFIGGSTGLRPTTTQQNNAGSFAATFSSGFDTGVEWCVYSRKLDSAAVVTNWFVDNEWDVVRSRGLGSTARVTGTA